MVCPACQSHNVEHLVDIGQQPMSLVALQDDPDQSAYLERYPIELSICMRCSHVFNHAFRPEYVAYTQAGCRMYNEGAGWQEHVKHVRSLVSNLNPEHIVEVGAGDCEFLASIDTNAVRVAVDPCEAVERAEELGLLYDRDYFDPDRHIPSDSNTTVVIMRHLLEHMVNPREFLERIVTRAKAKPYASEVCTCILIEVPCCEKALENGRVEDWTYEHPQNFTLSSLRALIQNCGANHFAVFKSYNDEVLVAQVFVVPDPKPLDTPGIVDRYRKVDLSKCRIGRYLWDHNESIAYWGGAGKSAMFLRQFGVPEDALVVDSHSDKIGFYVPGTRIEIRSPNTLRHRQPRTIVATTSWRAEDIRDDIKRRNIPCVRLLKFEGGDLVEVPFGQA